MNDTLETRKLMLYFPKCETEKPIVYHLVKNYDLIINIFRAKVTPEDEGFLVLDVTGSEEDIENGIEYIRSFNVEVREDEKGLKWEEERCVSCGNCVPHCPTEALSYRDRREMKVVFDDEKCIECLSCIPNCIYGACSSRF